MLSEKSRVTKTTLLLGLSHDTVDFTTVQHKQLIPVTFNVFTLECAQKSPAEIV